MKVMLGMSGGVDSSVAAALLLEQGYEVIGVTMQIWQESHDGACCSLSSVEDARNIANQLNIPYYVLNFKEVFKQKVIDYFIDEYLNGKTPNPCIACNKYLKFDHMLKKANAMGIDYIATGHYAKIEFDSLSNRFLLKKSITDKKDQTYFLYNFTQEQLSKTLMPVGNYSKDQIRDIASKLGLKVASKPDSQEICFVSNNDHGNFISKYADVTPGDFVDVQGNKLGKHKGIVYYTVGQRKNLGIALGRRMYVVRIDSITNTVVLGEKEDVFSSSLIAKELNFISIEKLDSSMIVTAKIRSSAKEAAATIYPLADNKVQVVFDMPQSAGTPGQAVVFYNGDVVVGGGIIEVTK